MEFTQSGLPLSFEVTYDSAALNVAMKVWDNTGGSPVLISTLPMTVIDGYTYCAKFTPLAGKSYVFNKSVYTDGTYLTRDSNYSQASESIRSEDIAGLIWNALTANYTTVGSFGKAVGGSSGASASVNLTGMVLPNQELDATIN